MPDIILDGDPTLNHALHDVAARSTTQTGMPVHVFTAPPSPILAQLRHEVWNDVVVTLSRWMDQAVQAGVIEPGTRTGSWRTTLVLAAATGAAGDTLAIPDARAFLDYLHSPAATDILRADGLKTVK